MSRWEEVLRFWFNGLHDGQVIDRNSPDVKKWFIKNKALDEEIRSRFADDFGKAQRGEYAAWLTDPRGALALVIVCDQFTRNMYRNTPQAFAGDPLALEVTLRMIKERQDVGLMRVERIFLYMPLMHAEDLAVQKTAVQCFESLVQECRQKDPANVEYYEYTLGYARRHHDIIQQFGRFPHRNAVLGRGSTEAEKDFLTRPGSSF